MIEKEKLVIELHPAHIKQMEKLGWLEFSGGNYYFTELGQKKIIQEIKKKLEELK